MKKEKKVKSILIDAFNAMNDLLREQIWKKRCSKTIEIELQFGINKRNKIKINNNNNNNNNNYNDNNIINNNNNISNDINNSDNNNNTNKITSEMWKKWIFNNIKYGQNYMVQLM